MNNPIIKLMKLKDSFANVIKGLGTSKDPREQTHYQRGRQINQEEANSLYIYNWLAAKVVDIPIDDATRKWRNLLIPDAEKKEQVEELMKSFDVKTKINIAHKWARVFGGAAILAIIDGDDPEEPLDIEKIRTDSLQNFVVLDRWNIFPIWANRDIMSKNFGQPEYYSVSRNGQKIHYTRLTKIMGSTSTIRELEQQNFWGNSIFSKQLEPIQDSQVTSQSIADLVYESNVDVYRIAGLNQLVAEGNDDLVVKRLKIAAEMKSIINGIALDKEDEYDKKKASFMNLDSIDDRFVQKVAGASDIPVTRLLGISPAGQNATGESDMLNYYDNIQSIQENEIRPHLDWMDSIILQSAGYTDPFEYEFKPLKQLTEIEQADVDLKNAQRDQIFLDYEVITVLDVQAQLAEDGTYVTIDENRVAEEEANEELDLGEEGDEPIPPESDD